MTEFSKYNELKEAIRAKLTRQPSLPDVEKIRKDVRNEVEEEFRKEKKCSRHRFELKFEKFNSGFHLSVTRDIT